MSQRPMCKKHDLHCPHCGHAVNPTQDECPSCQTKLTWHDGEQRLCLMCQARVPEEPKPKPRPNPVPSVAAIGETLAMLIAAELNVSLANTPDWRGIKTLEETGLPADCEIVDIPTPFLYACLRLIVDDNVGQLATTALAEMATMILFHRKLMAVPVNVNGQPKLAILKGDGLL